MGERPPVQSVHQADNFYLDNDVAVDVSDQYRLVFNSSPHVNGEPISPSVEGVVRRTNPFGDRRSENQTNANAGGFGGVYDNSRHCHPQVSLPRDKTAERKLLTVSAICFVFMIGEFAGGLIAHSLAIMTDAAHMLSDFASFLISLSAIWMARRHATKRMSFGFYRLEVLGAIVSILIIWVLTGILVYMAVDRVWHPVHDIEPDAMLATAACGVIFNIVMGIVLHYGGGHGHSHHGLGSHHHGHQHSHQPQHNHQPEHDSSAVNQALDEANLSGSASDVFHVRFSLSAYPTDETSHVNRQKNINVRAALIHVIGDLVQSVGVLVAALIIKFKPEWKIADPICTFVFSVLVLITTCTVLRDAVHVLMEGTPRDVDYDQVRKDLQSIEGVKSAHSLHMWSLTMDKAALAVHLAIDTSYDALKIMHEASKLMRFKYNLTFTTIQVEPYDPEIMHQCALCIGPTK